MSPRLTSMKSFVSLVSTPLEVLISVFYWSIMAVGARAPLRSASPPPL